MTTETPRRIRPMEALTRQQRAVAALLVEGLGNREIGERLYLTENTVKTHVRRIMKTLGATSRVQVAVMICRGDPDTMAIERALREARTDVLRHSDAIRAKFAGDPKAHIRAGGIAEAAQVINLHLRQRGAVPNA